MKNPFTRKPRPDQPDEVAEQKQVKGRAAGRLSTQAVFKNLIAADTGVWALYTLENVPWEGISGADRGRVMSSWNQTLYELSASGRIDFRLRGIPVPFPIHDFCVSVDQSSQARRFKAAGIDTVEAYNDTVEGRAFAGDMLRVQDYVHRHQTRKRSTVLEVRISPRKLQRGFADLQAIAGPDRIEGRFGRLEDLRLELRRVNKIITGSPDSLVTDDAEPVGRPMTPKTIGWLIHASVGMGMPVPTATLSGPRAGWEPDEVEGFTNMVEASQAPFAPTTELHTRRVVDHVITTDDGQTLVRADLDTLTSHVCVLHARGFQDRSSTELANRVLLPYLHHLSTAPFDVNFVVAGELIPPGDLETDAARVTSVAADLGEHRAEHGMRVDVRQGDAVQNAMEYENSVRRARPGDATRFRGVVMAAVTGVTEAEVMESKVPQLVSMVRRDARYELAVQAGQYASYRAFIPGEPVNLKGSVTQQRLPVFAAAVPHVDTTFGDRTGMVLGPIAGSRDLAILDPHGGPAAGTSGMILMAGQQGSGKTTLLASIAAYSVSTLAVRTVLSDPSGATERLIEKVPALAKHGRVVDLASAGSAPGSMSPSVLVPNPVRHHFEDDDAYEAATEAAKAERRQTLLDAFLLVLPLALGESARDALIVATNTAYGEYEQSPWDVIGALKAGTSEAGRHAGSLLEASANSLGMRQLMPRRGASHAPDGPVSALGSELFTILKLTGINPPAGSVERKDWDEGHKASMLLLYLSSRAATRAMYADKSKATVLTDEVAMQASSSFAGFAARVSADSRKWNGCVGFATQNPVTLFNLAPQITNLAGSVFVGTMKSHEAADAGLDLMGAPKDEAFRQALLSKRPGHWLARDWHGRIAYLSQTKDLFSPELAEATLTDPTDRSKQIDVLYEGVENR